MADDLPTPGKAVYLFFEFVALGFALEAVADIIHYHGPWYRWCGSFVAAAFFLWLGIKGPGLKDAVVTRLPWVRMKKELQAALSNVEELKRNQRPSFWETIGDPLALPSPKVGPDLRVDYRKPGVGVSRPTLVFRVRSGSPTTIKKVGPLVSEEAYRTENDFILLQEMIPEIELNQPVECQISSLRNPASGDLASLQEVLEQGGPNVSDSAVIEYTAGEQDFSRRFFLYKNADGSIVWTTENRQPGPMDLRILRRKLHLLRKAIPDLTYAGKLSLLMHQSLALESTLVDVLRSNANVLLGLGPPMDLSRPMSSKLIAMSDDDSDKALPWQRMRLMSFRDRYKAFNACCKDEGLPELPYFANELTVAELHDAFTKHRDTLSGMFVTIIKGYN